MIEIKIPTKEDVMGIQNVFYQTWLSTYPNKEAGVTKEDIEEKFKSRLSSEAIHRRVVEISNNASDKLFLVAKDGDIVVGICKAEEGEGCNQLNAIYVLPSYQRQGVGLMFWKKVEEFFDDKKEVIVKVAAYNEKAINFYKKLGFKETSEVIIDNKFKMPVSGVVITQMKMIFQKA